MEENSKAIVEIARIELDFDAIRQWRKTGADDLPACSVLSFYEAAGVTQIIRDYLEGADTQVTALDNLSCNFYTLQRIKNFINDIWSRYSLTISEDNKVEWDTHRYTKGVAHKPREPKARIRNSINYDFINYCPSVNDDLPDNVIVITMSVPAVITVDDEAVVETETVDNAEQI